MGSNGDKIRLSDEDWAELLPGRELRLGKTSLTIKPLGLEDLAEVIKQIRAVWGMFQEKGITPKNYRKPDNMETIAITIINEVPGLLESLTKLSIEDIKRLPLAPVVTMLNLAIDVNLESQEGLEKNLGDLAAKMGRLTKTGL